MTRARLAIDLAKEDLGKITYLLGAKLGPGPLPPNPVVDCSGFMSRVVARVLQLDPVDMVECNWNGNSALLPTREFLARFQGSQNQGALGRKVSVALALGPTGAGLFLVMRPQGGHGHIALSLGLGRTIESRGGKGICIVGALTNLRRGWDYAMKLDYLFHDVVKKI
jgi:cell wall-associated NlpC family hydrolase